MIAFAVIGLALCRLRWTPSQANAWYQQRGWMSGINFIPSTAVNQLEMWQADSFDPVTIDRQLGYAQSVGYRLARTFLHPLVWASDPVGFKGRFQVYLQIANKRNILVIPVMFDDCWNPNPVLGKQPDPIPRVHNSRWVQSPGASEHTNSSLFPGYQRYFQDVIGSFANDSRIYLWDIYNEPGNSGFIGKSMPLLEKAFDWAQAANPSQPISAGIWNSGADFNSLNWLQGNRSDVLTFHFYGNLADTAKRVAAIKSLDNRPVICTEYMARQLNSNVVSHLPMFKAERVPAINWGLVRGRTNTIYPWWWKYEDGQPTVWFHDIFNPDGTPFSEEEARLIRSVSVLHPQ